MSMGVKEGVFMCMECLLFALILTIIAFFGRYSADALDTKKNENAEMSYMQSYRSLYAFTLGSQMDLASVNSLCGKTSTTSVTSYGTTGIQRFVKATSKYKSTIVKGDDIVRFVSMNYKKYNIVILKQGTSTPGVYNLLTTASDESWLIEDISKKLQPNNKKDFYCMAVYNPDMYMYDCVLFLEKDIIEEVW